MLLIKIAVLGTFGVSASHLSLDDYLRQVSEGNDSAKASEMRSQALRNESREGEILTLPQVFAHANYLSDSSPSAIALSPTKTELRSYSLGVSELSPFGGQGKLSYDFDHYTLEGIPLTYLPVPTYFEAKPKFEWTQSLWRNFLGRETRAEKILLESKDLADGLAETFKRKQILAGAAITYWRLSLAKKTVTLRQTSFENAQALFEWTTKRVRTELADRIDSMQASANLHMRELEYKASVDQAHTLAREFNSLRHAVESEVSEDLDILEAAFFDHLDIPKRSSQPREDVRAAEYAKQLSQAHSEVTKQKALPDLALGLQLALSSHSASLANSFQDSFGTTHPVFGVGVNLTTSLDFKGLHRIYQGAVAEQRAAELDYQRKAFEVEREWDDLEKRFLEAKESVRLAEKLESLQSEKLTYERERLKKGRTTTFQVLTFEQDHSFAELNSLQSQAELLSLYTKLQLFSD